MDIGIVNAWGANRGDEAMLSSILCHLRAKYPNVQVTVYSRGTLDLVRFGITLRPWIAEDQLFPKFLQFPVPSIVSPVIRRIALYWTTTFPRVKRASTSLNHDCVISSPAGPYLGDMYPVTEPSCLAHLALCTAQGIPYGILGVSCGPFGGHLWNKLRKPILAHASFWTVREDISYEHLLSLGLQCGIYSGSDVVFAHPDREPANFLTDSDAEAYHHASNSLERAAIIVTLNTTPYLTPNRKRIPFDAREYAQKMGRLLAHVAGVTKCQIIIFPHFYGNARELRNIHDVIETSGCEPSIRVLDPRLNAEAQMHLYKKAVFCISHRYHPTIFAFRAGCPCLCIRHQFKADGLLKMFGDPGPVVKTTDSVEHWINSFSEAWRERDAMALQIRDFLPRVQVSASKHYEALDKFIAESAGVGAQI